MPKARLIAVFLVILTIIIAVTSWATSHMPFWKTPESVVLHPWFIATLTDTYLAFFTFWLWVAYKENSVLARVAWLVLIFALGNMAMAAYVLIQLVRLPRGATIETLLLRRQ
ncbi:DUF1475 family protein [Acidihalobacter ferrooxydans]|uniref:DUF1475 domain-containing protein n=1 Tax=Acidihalobacter ferrooxydans TaxID=1765967 RepID=A0A1P8UET2_9GAMM|nr:DUF1475 family protein [Acidihalobacter ferrooxydans]APZ42357.1 hypothetical protein BW247_04010 [Acidihalobacter ferrooxydans]